MESKSPAPTERATQPKLATNKRPPSTRRKRLARVALLRSLKRLQKVCGTLETPDQWYDVVKELQGALDEYGDVLPTSTFDSLNDATTLTDPTRVGLQKACEVLDNRLTDAISALPAGGLLAPFALAAALVAAVVVFVVVVFLNARSVSLDITNRNCQAIVITGEFPGLDWIGVELPSKPIAAASTGSARLPPLQLTVDATNPAQIFLALGAARIPVGNSASLTSATFNGISLLGKLTSINLGDRAAHQLVVQCK
jgi:hypothetical protein